MNGLFERAAHAFDAGRYHDALAACNALAESGAEPVHASFLRGLCHVKLHQDAVGFPLMQEAVKRAPAPHLIETLGGCYQERERMAEAFAMYQQLLSFMPDGMPEPYHTLYNHAVMQTRSGPFPLKRRVRFLHLMQRFEEVLNRLDMGDVVECGCFRGLSAFIFASLMKRKSPEFTGKGLILCDSFEGLGEAVAEDAIADDDERAQGLRAMMHPGAFAAPLDMVQHHLSAFPDIEYVKGWIPQSLERLPTDAHYRFVNLDVDMYEPTAGALAYFWPRLLVGGIIISDDYGWPGAKKAIDDFKQALPEGTYRFETNTHQQAWFEKI